MAVESDEGIEVVLSVGDLDGVVATLREFLHRANAVEVQAVIARADEPPALVTCGRLQPIEVVRGDTVVHMPHAVELEAAPAADIPSVPPLPPLQVDPEEGTVAGPLGGVEAAARAVEALAAHLGPPNVAIAFYPTTVQDVPLGLAARVGEPTVLTIGEQQFTLPG
jgi:hypothetical protein